ncbi:MAG: UPF0149 family protein [Gammaproteobacteria bacterium]|nr:UPF0149 family protein [Gammaproteobacteria bacterium]
MIQDPIEQLEQWLKNLDADIGATEFHGVLAGLITTCGAEAKHLYIEELIPAYDPADLLQQEAIEGLNLPYESLREQLNDPVLSFYPLMPDDEKPFDERVDAMAAWCQGYLFGLSRGGLSDPSTLSDETNEFLKDLLSFSRADNFELDGDEEDESALHEIIEYLRTGVIVVHDELQPVAPASQHSPQIH